MLIFRPLYLLEQPGLRNYICFFSDKMTFTLTFSCSDVHGNIFSLFEIVFFFLSANNLLRKSV